MTPPPRRRASALALVTSGCLASAAFLLPATPVSAAPVPAPPSALSAAAATNPTLAFEAPAVSVGVIPDGPGTGGTCSTTTPAVREVAIPVSGMKGPLESVQVRLTIGHPKLGDLGLALQAPDGTTTVIFDRPGAASVGCGFETGISGPIGFADGVDSNLVATAARLNPSGNITSGSFFPSTAAGVRLPLTTPFVNTNPNGTWKLRVLDYEAGNVGRVSRATLFLRAVDKRSSAACVAATAAIKPARQARNAATTKLARAKKKLVKAPKAMKAKAAKKVARKKKALKRANRAVNAAFAAKNEQCS